MIRIPFSEVKQKILASGLITEAELEKRIQDKLVQLSGLISKDGAAHIIANELGIKVMDNAGKIKDVYPGMRNISLNAKVLAVYEARSFDRSDGTQGKVCSAQIGDETGSIRLVGWGEQADSMQKLVEGVTIGISSGYARENNKGYKELHLNDKSKITINPPGITIEARVGEFRDAFKRKKIAELSEADATAEIMGTVVQVFDLRFFEVCSQCSLRLKQVEGGWECPTHKVVLPDYSYVLNVFLEDDTERIRIVLFSNTIQDVLKKSKPDLLAYREHPEQFEEIKTALLGEQFKLQGKIKKNTFFDRIEFIPNRMVPADPKEELDYLEQQGKGQA